MKTQIRVSPEQFAKTNGHWGRHFRRAYWRGLLLRERGEFWDAYARFSANKQSGPLSAQQVRDLVAMQDAEASSIEVRSKEMDVTKDIDAERAKLLGSRYAFSHLLQELLKSDRQITSAANIGARVDFYSAYLAPRFPNVRFRSVDFQTGLAHHNSLLPQASNWTFHPGYWLDLMRSGELKSDLYFCVSTSVLMNNGELNAFLDEASKHAKAFAFCEGWWPKANTLSSRIVPPEEVPKESPYCSGAYANYHHNYIAKLEDRGYKIKLSQIVPQNDAFHYLQIIASR